MTWMLFAAKLSKNLKSEVTAFLQDKQAIRLPRTVTSCDVNKQVFLPSSQLTYTWMFKVSPQSHGTTK